MPEVSWDEAIGSAVESGKSALTCSASNRSWSDVVSVTSSRSGWTPKPGFSIRQPKAPIRAHKASTMRTLPER